MTTLVVPPIKFLRLHPEAKLPTRGSEESVGLDLYAFCLTETGRTKHVLIPPRNTVKVETRIAAVPPPKTFLTVCSRSGLAASHSIFAANAPGIIDPDFRGEICILLFNGGLTSYYVTHGDRVAQLVCFPALLPDVQEVTQINKTDRGGKGFGSTGR
jgi:dUTP pyrophosphatase